MNKLIKWSFVLLVFSIFIAIAAKFYHYGNPLHFIFAILFFNVVFAICAIVEVSRSERISIRERNLWIAGFIFTGAIAGYFYVLHARKRITGSKQDMGDVL